MAHPHTPAPIATVPEMAAPPIEPPEIQPPTPGNPTVPPPEEPQIGASEIDTRRASLLKTGEVDPATVEQEYIDAKARYKAQVEAGIAWDKSTGLDTLRKDVDAA